MSGNWDDSDNDSEPVEIVEKPVILPRTRQPSIAKSLEKVAIMESSVAGSVKDMGDDSDDDSLSIGSENSEFDDQSGDVLSFDFDATTSMRKMISQFTWEYRNIVMEFADVEIFLISFDSLFIECAAHNYHNWQTGGQSVLIASQIDKFVDPFVRLGGKFKFVVFTDLATQFARDTTVAFARTCALAHLMSGPFAKDVVFFSSPVDPSWTKFLHDVTPSFLMISTDNFTKESCAQEDINLVPQLETIVLHALSEAIPIVYLHGISINFSSVFGHYIEPKLVVMHNWDSFVAAHWDCNSELLKLARSPSVDGKSFQSVADIWTKVITEAKSGSCSEHFDSLASACLLSALIAEKRGVNRVYLPERENSKRGLDVIRDRRNLLTTATSILERINFTGSKLNLSDFWDGRMVFTLFDYIVANEEVLPYRLQDEFAKYHTAASLSKPLAVDMTDKLYEPLPELPNPLENLPFLYTAKSPVIDKYLPELKQANSENIVRDGAKQDYGDYLREKMSWKFKEIEEKFTQKEEKIEDTWQKKRANKSRQFLSRWYEMFANSLEGRGSNLLVDFSRQPKGGSSVDAADNDKKKNKAWAGQKQGGGAKKGKEPVKSKKDAILEANKKAKDSKVIESEKTKIKFATQQGKSSVLFLKTLFSSLELPESRALCLYEVTMREAKEIIQDLSGKENQNRRRVECISLVSRIKECFVKYWPYLEDKQKDQIVDLWVSLGFECPTGAKCSSDAKLKKLDLGMNLVYYQLEYGGELIDILSDPQKDDRVTGFNPDAWQRDMLNSVDKGNSAIIVAPTSAGKTFISYYCIEKVLRNSDDDVVVLVSPSKALMNQMCGSVYARFKNKSMTRGKALFGTLTNDYSSSALVCQILVTVPESLETLLLSTNPDVQEFVSHIKYVVFDEVHSIGSSEEAHIWEHLLLSITCPFLALSATIGNANKLHEWLQSVDKAKTGGKRSVDIISYGERYSELELSVVEITKPTPLEEQLDKTDEVESPKEVSVVKSSENILRPLMPYGVFMPEKIKMFGIPDDQQLTARQILELYHALGRVDEKTKTEFEPCTYFGYKAGTNIWISRASLREFEMKLKDRFLNWLQNENEKAQKVMDDLGGGVVKEQLDYRSQPFNKTKVALDSIIPLVDKMREDQLLPAICFSDDRQACELLAIRLADELERREREFMETDEFKNNYAIKDEEKLLKLAKRKRELAEKKKSASKKGEKNDDDLPHDEDDDEDVLGAQRAKLKQVLEKFKLRGRGGGDPDLYDKFMERLERGAKTRESTRILMRLFERGIGYHHAALNMVEKGAVEVLFRSGHLAILFSTSTLALGVNMPCKSVVFTVDTTHLTPLLYRQMSGRAGRRGFDKSGTVIFMSIPTSKMRRLLTASLSNLQGNPPFSTTFLMRLFCYVHQKDTIGSETGQPLVTLAQRTKVALSIIENSFALFTRREAESGILQKQLKMFVTFSLQLLRHLQLLDGNCNGKNLAGLAAHLPENEIGILAFIHLLQKGIFHNVVKQYASDRVKGKQKILLVLAHLFTRQRLPVAFRPDDKSTHPAAGTKCQLFLPPLPEVVQKSLDEYNTTCVSLYEKLMTNVSPDHNIMSPVVAISGKQDIGSVFNTEHLVSPVFDGFSYDATFLPIIDVDAVDHRGRKIHYNAYIIDFFNLESRNLLRSVNQLPASKMWYLIHQFNDVLERLSTGLDAVARPQDPVADMVRELHAEFDSKFRSCFGMRTNA